MKDKLLLTAAQVRAFDKKAREKFGISTLVLMENAGRVVMEEAVGMLKGRPKKVAIFCGKGNNGGDGFCAARHLLAEGFKPDVYLAGKIRDVKNEARVNLDILLKLKQKVTEITPGKIGVLKNKLRKYSLIIDALLGVGAKGAIRPVYQEIIDVINASGVYVIAVDIPSGLDATSGQVLGRCIKADETVTFVAQKRGMVHGEASKHCGKVAVRSIGLVGTFLF